MENDMTAAAAIGTAEELWKSLEKLAGLELQRKGGVRGRDADFEEAVLRGLATQLALPAMPRSVSDLLSLDARGGKPKVSTELLLLTVLGTLGGFSSMMKEILDTLELAKASRAGQALSIAFKFDQLGSDPIRYTLEQFRAQVKSIRRTLESSLVVPTTLQLHRLFQVTRALCAPDGAGWTPDDSFPFISAAPVSGNRQLDDMLAELNQLIGTFRYWCRQFGTTRNDAYNGVRARYAEPGNPEHAEMHSRIGLAHDKFDLSIEAALHVIAQNVANGTMDAGRAIDELSSAMEGLTRKNRWVERTVKELLDILNLPTWRKRYELYSVWTGTVLLRTAKARAETFRFNLIDGELSFAFGGSRLAIYDVGGKQFEIWAELRSALAGTSKKRKKGIQPDFRVLESSLTLSKGDATNLVLECKHYLVQVRSEFVNAATDYARSCPNAKVLVVDHGPMDELALTAACGTLAPGRIYFFGDATVEDELVTGRLAKAVDETLFPPRTGGPAIAGATAGRATPRLPGSGVVAEVRVGWDASLKDIDLSLQMGSTAVPQDELVSFRTDGSLAAPPYARLVEDVRYGPGEECIEIGAWHFDEYEIVVDNFSHAIGQMGPGNVWCLLRIGGKTMRVECPPLGGSTRWMVGRISVSKGKPVFRPAS
jgi:hypothetical protein